MELYQIVTTRGVESDSVLRRLSREVEDKMQEGWVLSGSLSMCHTVSGLVVAQAMVKPRIEPYMGLAYNGFYDD